MLKLLVYNCFTVASVGREKSVEMGNDMLVWRILVCSSLFFMFEVPASMVGEGNNSGEVVQREGTRIRRHVHRRRRGVAPRQCV